MNIFGVPGIAEKVFVEEIEKNEFAAVRIGEEKIYLIFGYGLDEVYLSDALIKAFEAAGKFSITLPCGEAREWYVERYGDDIFAIAEGIAVPITQVDDEDDEYIEIYLNQSCWEKFFPE